MACALLLVWTDLRGQFVAMVTLDNEDMPSGLSLQVGHWVGNKIVLKGLSMAV